MYKQVSTDLNFAQRELDILKFWEENKIFKKSIALRETAPIFTFYDGPPTANGKPHIGHVLTRAIKDVIPRYKTMKGYKVLRKAGWDTHGLPVELEVEKKLGINGKEDIEKFGVEKFINECKKSVWKYESEWKKMSERVGYWADMENPYVTYHNSYIESVWWALKQIHEKELLYKGHKIVPYCPRCGTSLSSHEVAQGYKNVKETSAYVKFRVESQEENLYLLAWTTTPWTLPSNVALAISENQNYVVVKHKEEKYIMAEALVHDVIKEPYKIEEVFLGKELLGMRYIPLFNFTEVKGKAFYVVGGDFVTLTEGTGIVHIAPAFGEDDAVVGRNNKLPFVQLVNEKGQFLDCVEPWKGMFVKDADKLIINELANKKLLFKELEYEHSYPFCWRCDTSLLYYACETWFIKMTSVRKELIENNRQINWLPENIKKGRFGKFLENVVDWGISRSRYWGTPLPIWECDCGNIHVVGSIDELRKLGKNVPDDIELHKPYIDDVVLNCPLCGCREMKRVKEVMDCWFDAGSMPFAQWHYPFENDEIFEQNFPADFISEAIDQTRGWFYTLLAISTLLFDKPSYKNVIVLGHVQDKYGQKMSKHKGNVIDPWEVLNKQGADAVRWYFYTNSAPWIPSRFYEQPIDEVQKKFMRTLWNTYAFYVLYANIDNFNPAEHKSSHKHFSEMDRWILSKLNTLILEVTDEMDEYGITEATRLMQDFVDILSNWYVRRSREIFWRSGMSEEKFAAYNTLHTVLITVSKLIAPFVPFVSEEMYKNIVVHSDVNEWESVHLCKYPEADISMIDEKLESDMDYTLKVVNLGRAARNAANIKNRQPLNKMYVCSKTKVSDKFEQIIRTELNIQEIIFTDDVNEFTIYKLKPQLKLLGPKYGKLVSKIADILRNMNGLEVINDLKNNEKIILSIGHTEVILTEEDILIEICQKEGFISQTDKDVTVVLDTNLTPELIEKGIVREVISKIQTMRKEFGLEIVDKIIVICHNNKKLQDILIKNKMDIIKQVLAVDIKCEVINNCYSKDWDINGEMLTIGIAKQ